jgi:NAD(P)H-dependent FMN reductase
MEKLKIQIILGSTRENRFGEKPAQWIVEKAKQRDELHVELLDLRNYPLPIFNESVSPKSNKGQYDSPEAAKWAEKIGEGDGYIWISPEYNHSYSAVLKNAIDYVYQEWNKKPVAFLSYGTVGGARAVEHLRGIAAELQLVSVHQGIHLLEPWNLVDENGNLKTEQYEDMAAKMLDQLTWWAKLLKSAH